ncbi:hypothetical protein C0J50_5124 [Silurus asotus]|uniref:Ig-like domain-containing protein n=1 Tax=Silurus asotus TaxID=30991 RepID=A0AAD5FB51_SILAS|nr:hypothetical protein C0J50_5124 [Silurus asotus]
MVQAAHQGKRCRPLTRDRSLAQEDNKAFPPQQIGPWGPDLAMYLPMRGFRKWKGGPGPQHAAADQLYIFGQRIVALLCLISQIFKVSLSWQVPCKVELEKGVQYRRITWYKVSFRSDMLVGLVMKDIRTNITQLYKFVNHSYQIGDDLSLLHVPEHSPEECDIYRCSVWPPVGHRILQSDYSLPQVVNLLELCMSSRENKSFTEIPCQAKRESEVQYRRITWYKVQKGSEVLTGLVTKDLHTQKTVLYKFVDRSYEVKDDYSLLFPNAGQSDCGHYRCTLWPPVGHYIQEGDYELYALALCYASEETHFTVQSEFNTTATLPCVALNYSNHYTSLTWYKDSPNKEGIIRISTKLTTPVLYKYYENRTDVSLTNEGSLVLEMVNFSQAGTYKCYLAGKVGHRNNVSYVMLSVTEMVSKTTPTTLNVTTEFTLYSTLLNSSVLALAVPVDVNPLSVLVGFFSLSLSKVLLCFMCVWRMTFSIAFSVTYFVDL